MKEYFTAIVITVIALLGVVARLIWPEIKIDSITIGLLFIALIPWLPKYLKSAKLPGGWEINFKDLEAAGKKIIEEEQKEETKIIVQPSEEVKTLSYLSIADDDPGLGLVGLRIELEKRIRELAEKSGIDNNRNLRMVVSTLHSTGVLNKEVISGLNEIINAGNSAAHGASVDSKVANWAINQGPKVLAALDSKISKATGRDPVTGY